MKRISATSNSSLQVVLYRFAALTFIAMLFGGLLLPNPIVGDSTEARATVSQVGPKLAIDEPPPYAPWVHLAELTESQGSSGDGFGEILAISEDGDTIVAGIPERNIYHDDVGLVRVYTRPEKGEWEDAQETATLTASDGGAIAEFGLSVAISDDLIVVGEFYSPVYVFVNPSGGWQDMTETARLRFVLDGYEAGPGGSVAIMGDSILAGDSSYHNDSFPHGNSGAIFIWNKPANGWADTDAIDAMLTLSGEDTPSSFGEAMAASGNTLIVGGGYAGAYIFERPPGGWANMTETAKLSPSSKGAGFGTSVAIDGDTVVVGAPTDDLGDPAAWEGSVFL